MKASSFAKKLPLILLVLVLLITAGFGYLIKDFLQDKPKPKKIVQQVTVLLPPPPPPPPEIEPEEVEPEIEEEIIEEMMEEAMPEELGESLSDDLGLDADGSAGADGFGLKARKGGRGFLGGGSAYASQVQTTVNDLIANHSELPYRNFEGLCKVWFDKKGRLEKFELVNYSGEKDVKQTLVELMMARLEVSNGPPLEMPQPIKLRLRNEI